jgi:hypothetical protein
MLEIEALVYQEPGTWPVFVEGCDGKRYPSQPGHPRMVEVQAICAYALARGMGLRELARRLGRSHNSVRRWAIAGRHLIIV